MAERLQLIERLRRLKERLADRPDCAHEVDELDELTRLAERLPSPSETEELRREVERRRALADDSFHVLETILETSPHGIIVADKSGKLILQNRATERIWRGSATADTVDGWGKYRAFHADGRPYEPQDWAMARAIEKGETTEAEEVHFQRFDDSHGTLLGSSAPIRAGNEIKGAVSVFADITRFKEMEREANQAKDEFMALLGHELRNPLSPMLTALELMRLRGDGVLQRERDVLERQVRHLMRLVDDLLDVARVASRKITLERRPTSLAEVVATSIEMASPLVEQRSQHLAVTALPDDALVDGDPHRLAQVFANLLTNAAKYTPDGGDITLSVEADEAEVRVRISDSGIGISPEFLPRIFDLFSQAQRTLDRTGGGLGIGLAIVRNVVELHGGSVEASSEGLDRGSTFTVRLPRLTAADRTAPHDTSSFAPRTSASGPRVLVVDDNVDAAEMLQAALSMLGCDTEIAHDGPSALDAAGRFKPEVVFLDIGLPVMSGYEVAEQLRKVDGKPRLIALTGYGQASDREKTRKAGFDRHLVKPIDLAELSSLIGA